MLKSKHWARLLKIEIVSLALFQFLLRPALYLRATHPRIDVYNLSYFDYTTIDLSTVMSASHITALSVL